VRGVVAADGDAQSSDEEEVVEPKEPLFDPFFLFLLIVVSRCFLPEDEPKKGMLSFMARDWREDRWIRLIVVGRGSEEEGGRKMRGGEDEEL